MRNAEQELSLKVFVVLSKAYRALMARAERDMKGQGFSPLEFSILELLHFKGKFPLQQLGERVLLTSGGITYNIDKLEAKGWLKRVPFEEDRRVIYAEITPQGRAVLEAAFPRHAKEIDSMVGILDAEEKQTLLELLKKLGKQGASQTPKEIL